MNYIDYTNYKKDFQKTYNNNDDNNTYTFYGFSSSTT